MSELRIRCRNTGKRISIPFGSNLYEAFAKADFQMEFGPVAARVNKRMWSSFPFLMKVVCALIPERFSSFWQKQLRTLIPMRNCLLAVLSAEAITANCA